VSDHILVLGAGGFVGRHLVRSLVARAERIITITRQPVDFGTTKVDSFVGDLREPGQFMPFIARSRAVVHLASGSTPGSSAGNAMAELHDNLQPTLALLQALQREPQTKLLYLSSGGSLYDANSYELATETADVHPRSYHGAGKIAAEHFISAWCSQCGGTATIVRPSNIYGPGQTERTGFGIVPAGFGKTLRGETLTVWGDGSAIRDYLYIDDLTTLCMSILAADMPMGSRIFNAASGIGVSLNDLLDTMEAVTGKKLRRTYDVGRSVDAQRVVMDATLAKRQYGWTPKTPLHEGLRQTWNWFTTTQH
jgi:UDP-glucose 4-epimerase